MSVKFPFFLGGGVLGGGGECRFYFYGRADFSDLKPFCSFLLGFSGVFICIGWFLWFPVDGIVSTKARLLI